MRVTTGLAAAFAGSLVLSGCTSPGIDEPTWAAPPVGSFDYQLGGAYEPPVDAVVIARDSTEQPAAGMYNICYVNGFQTQPGEGEHWLSEHPDLVLRDESGQPLVDAGWPDEYLLDTSTDGNRMQIRALIGTVIASCATNGFDAVEIDNLDSWTRSDGALTIEGAIDLAAGYARVAHDLGLAIAQKNGAGDSARFRDEVGFDFAVTEECVRYDECDDYLDAYDGLVFDIEYGDPADVGIVAAFREACDDPGRPASIILRDLGLASPGDPGYLRESC